MSLKPILFNTDMVRAILEDCKTVTRRVVKPQHLRVLDSPYHKEHPETPDKVLLEKLCEPPYRPGDILYVRETFQIDWLSNIIGTGRVRYKADDSYADFNFSPARYDMMRRAQLKPGWRPNENMPREAARIFLRVTDVRVQQLKDVTEEDARAEGFYTRAGLVMAILKMYPDCTEESWLWVIAFERISREEVRHA